jgi:hypothetical protein
MAMPASWQASSRIPASFPDGTSHTLLFAERYALCNGGGGLWGQTFSSFWLPVFAAWSFEPFQVRPSATDCDPRRASTPFGGLQVALTDGSVRSVKADIDQQTWWALCTPDGGEVLGSDW